MLRLRYFLPAACLATFFPAAGAADEDWSLCRVPSIVSIGENGNETAATRVEADRVISDDGDILRLRGSVRLSRGQLDLSADDVLLDQPRDRIEASGEVVFQDRNYLLRSPRVEIDNRAASASFERPEFELYTRHARGSAARIEKIDPYRSRFDQLEYTSCDPDDRDWYLRASKMKIDTQSGRGSATHARLYIQDLPFLYLPYFQFPIDDRRMTGLLAPGIGYSEDNGGTLALPVYINLAPNYDMTVTPVWFGKRGLQLNTENRYLFESQRGQIDLSYLDDDATDESRWFQQWQHNMDLAYDVDADLLLAEVSDDDIFDDFDRLAPRYRNTRHLERRLDFTRRGEIWSADLLWQDYQTLDRDTDIEDRPYNRLPRLALAASPEPWIYDLQTPLSLELVEFDRDDSVTGQRSHLVASLDWRAADGWYFFEPGLQLSATAYDLDDTSGDDDIERSLPTLGIDSGLIFERPAGSGDEWLQTLEPRLYFLHTPYEDQDEIPDFDTSLNANTYNNLFRNNRFTGADRIGDASQVTVGIGSRLYDNDSGNELMHLRSGQIFYFKDRRVSLDGSRDEDSKSDVITELDVWPDQRVKLATRLVYSQDENDISERDFSVNYADRGYAANFGYYFDDDELEQALLSMVYPLNERWTLVAKYHRSLQFERAVENLLGLSYESCCWGLKILAGRRGDKDEDFADSEDSIYFELTLKGLSQAGQDIDAQLREAIPGYEPAF